MNEQVSPHSPPPDLASAFEGWKTPEREKARRTPWICLVLLVSFLVYAPSVQNDFTWDDRWAAMGQNGEVRNAMVAELQPLTSYFETHYWPSKIEVSHCYRPVTVLTFALRHAFFGDNAMAGHLINVLLHVLATWLCYGLVRRLGYGTIASSLAALVFGVHAIHSEAVANLVGRAELLGFCFGAGGLLLIDVARRARVAWRVAAFPAASALFFLAFHSKESALAWAAFTPLYLLARPGRSDETQAARRFAAAAALTMLAAVPAAAFLMLRAAMIAGLPGADDPSIGYLENPLLDVSLQTRLLTGTLLWGYGLLLTLVPFSLAVDYGPCQMPIVTSFGEPWVAATILSGVVILALMLGGLAGARRHPRLFLAMAAFFGFSVIVTNLPLPIFTFFAERTYYTPSLGLSLLVAWIARRTARSRATHPILLLLLGAWVGASALQAMSRNHIWRDDETLILHQVRQHPDSIRMRLCAGDLHAGRGELATARRHFTAATRLDPMAPEPWLELGTLSLRTGDLAEAERALRNAALGRPRDVAKIEPELRTRLARVMLRLERPADALAEIERMAPDRITDDLAQAVEHLAATAATPALRERARRVAQRGAAPR